MTASASSPSPSTPLIALVTGSNRGLGFETARELGQKGYRVILTARNESEGREATSQLEAGGIQADFIPMDVTRPESVEAAAREVERRYGKLDALVNNAGVLLDSSESMPGGISPNALAPDVESTIARIRTTFETNTLGALRVAHRFVPLLRKSERGGRIVNVSSGMGQLTGMNGGWPAYRLSKTALNAVTRILSDELAGSKVKVNSVCPGWVKTDMGGPEAERSPEEGADTIVWLATLPASGPTGGFFRDREPIDW